MKIGRRSLALLIAALLILGGCGRQEQRDQVFGTQARFPDDEGVVTDINFERLVLDEARRHDISPDVQSFSTYDGTVTPLLHHKGRYVQVGLDDKDRVEWVAGIGLVLQQDNPVVIYNGVVERVDSRRGVIFRDGTVLKLSSRVTPPEPGLRVKATIDPDKGQVVEIVPQ